MNKCLVCGKINEISEFGSYCSKECRDSDIAVLGKMRTCSRCGNEFKSFNKDSLCINCLKAPITPPNMLEFEKPGLSSFKYSIFEDNIQRILDASNKGDRRNCVHAVSMITSTIDSSMLPELLKLLDSSNEKAKVWLIEIMARLRDKRAISYLENCLNSNDEEVQTKALATINLLRECS